MSDAVLEKLEEMDQRLQQIENVVKGGNQPDSKLQVEKNGGPGCKPVALIMKEARQGGKFNGVEVGTAESILQREGHDRRRKAVLNLMRRISEEFPKFKFRKGNSTRGSELQFHPDANPQAQGGSE